MAEYTYDHVVVGAGISGLTAALLLAQQKHRVLIIEKAPAIGGSMVRFPINGIPFETGFHFTGGLAPKGLLFDMLKALGVEDRIKPVPFAEEDCTRFVFEDSGNTYAFAGDRAGAMAELKRKFPEEAKSISTYFVKLDAVCEATTSMNLRSIGQSMHMSDEDYMSLTSVLDELFQSSELKAILGGYCLCYGVSPTEISFAKHARMCQGMHDGIVRVEDGGDAFVAALKEKLDDAGVEVRCKTSVVSCEEIESANVGAFRLNNGDLVRFESAVLTIHPQAILDLLPRERLRPAFVKRVEGFQSSFGFFAVFGTCDAPELLDNFVLLGLPESDLNALFTPGDRDADSMLFCISGQEKKTRTLTILEAACPEDYAAWADSSLKRRPAAYNDFKARKTERIVERVTRLVPELKGHFQPLESSTPLTFRDYLNSPDGSAYGVKQLMGQFNLLDRLPLKNLRAAGQSSVLPGVMGAMVSSFIVCRTMGDAEKFDSLVRERLDA